MHYREIKLIQLFLYIQGSYRYQLHDIFKLSTDFQIVYKRFPGWSQ